MNVQRDEVTQRGQHEAGLIPRRWVLSGQQSARGVLLDPAVISARELRARVLEGWCAGTVVSALDTGELLVLWPEARALVAERAPGLAVVARGGAWVATALSAREWEAIAPVPPDAVVRARAGVLEVRTGRRAAVDPAEWIELHEVRLAPAASLGAPPRPIAEPDPPPEVALRQALLKGAAREKDPESDHVVAEMKAMAEARRKGLEAVGVRPRASGPGGGGRRAGWGARLRAAIAAMRGAGRRGAQGAGVRGGGAGVRGGARGLWARLRDALRGGGGAGRALPSGGASSEASPPGGRTPWWRRALSTMFGGRGDAAAAATAPSPDQVDVEPDPPTRGALARAFERFRRYFALSRWAGERSARYLTDMLDKFERGDLGEALRHAIPLADAGEPGASQPSTGALGPRSNLQISTHRATARASLFTSDHLYAHLQRLYRSAFDRLVREGRFEEAAFVLAELLGQSHEAVAFLERHKKYRLAAELAEGRKLEPSIVVRQWMIAGDTERAVTLARRHGAFAVALASLERTHPDVARQLRLLWADLSADTGDYAGAVELVWPLTDARALAAAWIDRAIEVGGTTGARMIARKVQLDPEAYDELRVRVLELCNDRDVTRADEREQLARGLLRVPTSASRRLAHPLARALLHDRARGAVTLGARELRALAEHAQDAALRADVPEVPSATGSGPHVFDVVIGDRDVGRTPLYDAARLGSGQLAVACGEGGVRWLTRDGRTVAQFDVPAYRLVVSDHGDRLLALAPRGSLTMVSKIDLRERRAKPWLDLELVGHADTFDGSVWYVLEAGAVSALDLLSVRAKSVWRVSTEGPPVAVARDAAQVSFVVQDDASHEVWNYELPMARLRSRRTEPGGDACAVGASGVTAVIREGSVQSSVGDHHGGGERPYAHAIVGVTGELCAVRRDAQVTEVELYADRVRMGHVTLGGTSEVFVRLQGRELLVGDRAGRLTVRSLAMSARRVDLRL